MERQTTLAKTGKVPQQWHVIDADGLILGRMAARVAVILMGKHKPIYTPHVDTGDFVVILNASKVKLSGRKLDQKFKSTYSRYPGGYKQISYRALLERKPEELIELAVSRMLPKNALAEKMLKKLKVYAGTEHPHAAQNPQPLAI
ncbi:MAG: 50S ribosomal protein L13 [Phycisphaerales bacterium]